MHKQSGFTLIETLIYIGLFLVVIGGGLLATFNIIEANKNLQSKVVLDEDGGFILAKVNWLLTGSKTISAPAAGNTGTSLTVTKCDTGTYPNPFHMSLNGASIESDIGGTSLPLDAANVTVTSLQFTHLTSPQEGVSAAFTLSTTSESRQVYTENFTTTKYLRPCQ